MYRTDNASKPPLPPTPVPLTTTMVPEEIDEGPSG